MCTYPHSTAMHMPLPSEQYPSTLPVRQQMLAQPVGGNPRPYGTCWRSWIGYVDADNHSSPAPKIACGCCRLLCPLPHLRCHTATSLKTSEQPQRDAGGSWGSDGTEHPPGLRSAWCGSVLLRGVRRHLQCQFRACPCHAAGRSYHHHVRFAHLVFFPFPRRRWESLSFS